VEHILIVKPARRSQTQTNQYEFILPVEKSKRQPVRQLQLSMPFSGAIYYLLLPAEGFTTWRHRRSAVPGS